MARPNTNFRVFLNLASRGDALDDVFTQNRIPLHCNSVGITTGKQVLSFPVPMSGLVTGESLIAALDLGMADKSISLSGVLHETVISKKFMLPDEDGEIVAKTATFTAFEIAQLLHSYVDSSFLQPDQNLNELIILMPSRVNKDFNFHTIDGTTVTATTELKDLPLVPFSYKVRDLDHVGGANAGDSSYYTTLPGLGDGESNQFPPPVSDGSSTDGETNIKGLKGFIRNFNTNIVGESPFIEFSLDFQIANLDLS